jgi:putative tryptophan/tyrosine transport system substrate-binding protein
VHESVYGQQQGRKDFDPQQASDFIRPMNRREFITFLGSAAATPSAARAQQPLPVVEYLHPGSPEVGARDVAAFRKGLGETGCIEGQNVTVGYHWLEGQYDRVPALMADLLRRPVAVIAIPSSGPAARVAKAATSTIPIVFGVAGDPVRMGLVASLARPDGNATGVNFLAEEVASKRLRLLHDVAPKVARVAVLVNPANANATENTLRDLHEAAPTMGLELRVVKATTIAEIDAAFATFARERPDALSLSALTASSAAGACNLRSWPHVSGYPLPTPIVDMSRPAA